MNDKDSAQNVNTPGAPHADIAIAHGAVDPLVAYLVRQRMKDGLGRNHIVSLCYRPENNNYVWVQYDRDGPDPIHHVLDMGPDVKMERLYVTVAGADLIGSVTGKVIGVHPPGIPGDFEIRGVWAPLGGSGVAPFSVPEPSQQTFRDVPTNSVFWRDVEQAAALGIVAGYADAAGVRTFRPEDKVSRAQLAAFVMRVVRLLLTGGSSAQSASKKGEK
jgi:hypothetical protein